MRAGMACRAGGPPGPELPRGAHSSSVRSSVGVGGECRRLRAGLRTGAMDSKEDGACRLWLPGTCTGCRDCGEGTGGTTPRVMDCPLPRAKGLAAISAWGWARRREGGAWAQGTRRGGRFHSGTGY